MIALDRISGLPHSSGTAVVNYAEIALEAMEKLSLEDTSTRSMTMNSDGTTITQTDLNLHLDTTNTHSDTHSHCQSQSDAQLHSHPDELQCERRSPGQSSGKSPSAWGEFRVTAGDLLLALGRVTPSAIREVTIEVPGE